MKWSEKWVLKLVKTRGVPDHIAFIMDGNRRWAVQRGKRKSDGHFFGFQKLLDVLEWCFQLGIHVVTVFAFSTDNFKRSEEEVEQLMKVMEIGCQKFREEQGVLHVNRVGVKIVGNLDGFREDQKRQLEELETCTAGYDRYKLNICVGYGGVQEMVQAAQRLKIGKKEVSRKNFQKALDIPDKVDLLIRTGESRLSNFLIYQCCETTKFLMMEDVYWPQLSCWHLVYSIFNYQYLLQRNN